MTKLHSKALSATLLLLVSQFSVAEVVVVVNPASGISSISENEANRLFLGKINTINGKKLKAVDQKEGNIARTTFYEAVVKKSEAKLKAYWSTRIFSGKGTPPKSLNDDNSIKSWVSSNPKAIGYIDNTKVDGSVVVVYTVK